MKLELDQLRNWVAAYLGRLLLIDPGQIDLRKSLEDFGLDSVDALIMAGELEEHFHIEIEPSVLFEFGTLHDMIEAWGRGEKSP